MTPGPGFAECSANIDGFTGTDLVRMKLWNMRIAEGAIGLHLSIVRLYFDLYEALADLTQDAGMLLRRFFAIQAAVYELYPTTSVDGSFRERACRLLADNPQPSFRTRDAARIMGVTEPTFRRRFHELTGMAPGDYHLQLRMERAEQLLAHHSVKDTAEQLGYGDPFVFSRQFKRATGMAPSERLPRARRLRRGRA